METGIPIEDHLADLKSVPVLTGISWERRWELFARSLEELVNVAEGDPELQGYYGIDCVTRNGPDHEPVFLGHSGGENGVCRFLMAFQVESSDPPVVELGMSTSHFNLEEKVEIDAVELFRTFGNRGIASNLQKEERDVLEGGRANRLLMTAAWGRSLALFRHCGIERIVAHTKVPSLARLWVARGFEPSGDPDRYEMIVLGTTDEERVRSDVSMRRAIWRLVEDVNAARDQLGIEIPPDFARVPA